MSEVEWVEESDWSKVMVGDRVKLLRKSPGSPDDEFIFTVKTLDQGTLFALNLSSMFSDLTKFILQDSDILFVERPVVQLPTEPGLYLDKDGLTWQLKGGELSWHCFNGIQPEVVSSRHFRRLCPADEVRAETAKEVVEHVKKNIQNFNVVIRPGNIFDDVAKKFGVTDE